MVARLATWSGMGGISLSGSKEPLYQVSRGGAHRRLLGKRWTDSPPSLS